MLLCHPQTHPQTAYFVVKEHTKQAQPLLTIVAFVALVHIKQALASPYALTVQWGAIHQPPTHQHVYHALLDNTVINQVKHPAQAVL